MNEQSSLDDLADLYRLEHVGMVRLAFLLTGSRSLSEELVHDAFIIVYERRRQIQQPGAYLRQTVVNQCRTKMRRQQTAFDADGVPIGSWSETVSNG